MALTLGPAGLATAGYFGVVGVRELLKSKRFAKIAAGERDGK
jgi:hypothetical protein